MQKLILFLTVSIAFASTGLCRDLRQVNGTIYDLQPLLIWAKQNKVNLYDETATPAPKTKPKPAPFIGISGKVKSIGNPVTEVTPQFYRQGHITNGADVAILHLPKANLVDGDPVSFLAIRVGSTNINSRTLALYDCGTTK